MRNVRIFSWMIVGVVSAAAAAETTLIRRPEPPGKPGFDARLPREEKDRGGFVLRAPAASQRMAAEALGAEMPGLILRWNGMSGGPKWIAAASERSLTPPSTEDPEVVARAFLRARAADFGLAPTEIDRLKLHAVVRTPAGGPHVHLVQRAWGLEVFGSHVKVNLDPNGAVRSEAREQGRAASWPRTSTLPIHCPTSSALPWMATPFAPGTHMGPAIPCRPTWCWSARSPWAIPLCSSWTPASAP